MAKCLSNSSSGAVKTTQSRGMTSAPLARRPPVRPASAPTPAPIAAAAPACKPAAAQITHEAIARRAREIWLSGRGGTDLANWLQAEKELRAAR